MEQRTFPGSDVQASLVGLGCNNFGMRIDADASNEVVNAALESGVTFFDTAAMYGAGKSEEFLGAALGSRRDEAVIATKFPAKAEPGASSPEKIREACDVALRRLDTDRIDLFQQHYPDPDTPMADIAGTLAELRSEGKIRAAGHSNFSADQHDEAASAAESSGIEFVSSQIEWSLLNRVVEAEIIPACQRNNAGVLPYFPLASGLLTGKHQRNDIAPDSRLSGGMAYFEAILTDENFDKVERLTAWAEDHGRTLLELAFQWLASQPGVVSVIAGATKASQVQSNAAAVSRLLTPSELAEIDQL